MGLVRNWRTTKLDGVLRGPISFVYTSCLFHYQSKRQIKFSYYLSSLATIIFGSIIRPFSTTNLPLRGGKGYQWEGGIREPYFIKVPQLKDAPKEINTAVTGADFYPTLLDFTGIAQPQGVTLDGKSLKPLFKGENLGERTLYWHYPHYGNQGGEPSSIIRKGNFKLIYYYESNTSELYNLENDPAEQTNIASVEKERTRAMQEELLNYLDEVGANKPKPNPDYDVAKAKQQQIDRREKLLPRLEAERKEMLSKEYQPNATWWDSKVTKD